MSVTQITMVLQKSVATHASHKSGAMGCSLVTHTMSRYHSRNEASLSESLSKNYNLKHYYGAGPSCSEDIAFVLHPLKKAPRQLWSAQGGRKTHRARRCFDYWADIDSSALSSFSVFFSFTFTLRGRLITMVSANRSCAQT